MVEQGLLRTSSRGFGRRGRPESLFSLSATGVALLQEEGVVGRHVPLDAVTGGKLVQMTEHQILLNWVAIECARLHRNSDKFSVQFISSTSPHHVSAAGGTVLYDRISKVDGTDVPFTPDAAFCITRRKDGKSLLFFVEVDMGTEAVAGSGRNHDSDVRSKISVYRTYLARMGYKRYEGKKFFDTRLKGFRLLLVTREDQRYRALYQMLQGIRLAEFACVAALSSIGEMGIGGPVWSAQGKAKKISILGSQQSL